MIIATSWFNFLFPYSSLQCLCAGHWPITYTTPTAFLEPFPICFQKCCFFAHKASAKNEEIERLRRQVSDSNNYIQQLSREIAQKTEMLNQVRNDSNLQFFIPFHFKLHCFQLIFSLGLFIQSSSLVSNTNPPVRFFNCATSYPMLNVVCKAWSLLFDKLIPGYFTFIHRRPLIFAKLYSHRFPFESSTKFEDWFWFSVTVCL